MGAVIFWVLAIAAEVAAILMLTRYILIPEENLMMWLLIALGVDLVMLIIGSQLWKRANKVAPASKKNKLKFWLWNNLGVIVSVIAFLPILILLLNDKKLDGSTKKIVSIVAAVALVVGGLASYDFNPVSREEFEQMAHAQMVAAGSDGVSWTTFGKKYHLYEDCSSIVNSSNKSEETTNRTVEEAYDTGRVEQCLRCFARAGIPEDGVVSDGLVEALTNTVDDLIDETGFDDVDEDMEEDEAA